MPRRHKGPTPRRPHAHSRELEGIPGTVELAYQDHEIIETSVPAAVIDAIESAGADALFLRRFTMGQCTILTNRERAGKGGKQLWHLSISRTDRHPTWSEIKVARYRLLPHNLTFGLLLPPPKQYVNLQEQDHVFHCWQVEDPRE